MTVLVESFLDQLIQERFASASPGGSVKCTLVTDNAALPSRAILKLHRKHLFEVQRCRRPRPAYLRSASTNSAFEESSLPSSRNRNPLFPGPHQNLYHPHYEEDELESKSMNGRRQLPPLNPSSTRRPDLLVASPTSVVSPPGSTSNNVKRGILLSVPVSPRSARWITSSSPPILKTKSGMRRLESDSALTCPKRLLLSPAGGSSSSHSSTSRRDSSNSSHASIMDDLNGSRNFEWNTV